MTVADYDGFATLALSLGHSPQHDSTTLDSDARALLLPPFAL